MKKGFTLIEVVVVIATIAIIAAISFVGVLRARMTANESIAKANLRMVSNALENYANMNSGLFPTSENVLISGNLPYIGRGYCGETIYGYKYGCYLSKDGYLIAAVPLDPDVNGRYDYSFYTGGEAIDNFQYDEAIAAVLQSPSFWKKTVAKAPGEPQEPEPTPELLPAPPRPKASPPGAIRYRPPLPILDPAPGETPGGEGWSQGGYAGY